MSPQNTGRSSLFGALFVPALILGVLIILAILVISFRGGDDRASSGGDNKARTLSADTMSAFDNEYDAIGESVGSPDAPVTIREFADYQCPACGAFAPTAQRIRDELVESGQARFVFFDFPLPMHAHAQEAAVAARCAARQDKFWSYHDRLFETQRDWSQRDDPTSMFLDMAVESGVNARRLEACMTQGGPDDVIARNQDAGKAISLRATPTVIVGDQMFSGVVGYDKIRQVVEQQASASD
ncbi:Protein-disulfide isomerase [Salinisphaera shabanensis E1L3A]|uniref:Protein-disulfide isomerase n=1 Tax=Salinisphaera shabanensis E1L3A TaxID=1033802 RepID=F7Q821_9GAMM|nr:thioredoxin domain-containing protein [Salinisphaera shabanensis]ERJ19091.1 Protein-disulfide isomerase [Salinisphaera shabanensis E1L3A]